MTYIERNLLDDERIIYLTRPHWIIFAPPLICSVLAIVFLLLPAFLMVIGLLALATAFFMWISAIITYISSEFGLTNRRVMVKTGFIRRYSLELLLPRVESILVDQTILGRLFGYGTIIICGTGGSRDPFRNIDDPITFRHQVQAQLEETFKSP